MFHREDEPDRLDSWKAIAAYLKRDLATVRRWERSLGLPVRRVAGSGRSVFAYKSEIDAWLKTERPGSETSVNTERLPPTRIATIAKTAAASAVLVLAVIGLYRGWSRSSASAISHVVVTADGVAAFDAAGIERWRHRLPDDLMLAVSEVGTNWLVAGGLSPAVYAVVSHTVRRSDRQGGAGSLLEFSLDGVLRRSFSFDDEFVVGGKRYRPPWVVTTLAVDDSTGARRVAVAGHHYQWDPSPVTVLDEQWRRAGTFLHAGWVEALYWISSDRLLIGGYAESRHGGMVALLDPARLDGQGPETPGGPHHCETCGGDQLVRQVVMPRTEVNRASNWRFNRALVERLGDRLIARTIELEHAGGHADVIYEFSLSLELLSAAFSERYWDAHRMLEAEGKLNHSRAECPDRRGPSGVLVWEPATGWQPLGVDAQQPSR
jgi:hypothetical protein